MLTVDKSKRIPLTPDDFDPPLKRKEPTVPGYWLVDEIAAEIGCSTRKVMYDITGRPDQNRPSILKGYKAGTALLVPDAHALPYILEHRAKKLK
ncbi:MAG: hypothetical protein N5P05_004695 (plasmid) [Chroococcopsis gigantea SAG 12.99]|jgi:hypothetical protein|nr:hypothetical protein [Chroococcopsis gigantea SAG 12.99]